LLYLLLGALFSELGEEKKKREEGVKGILQVVSSFLRWFFLYAFGVVLSARVLGCQFYAPAALTTCLFCLLFSTF
jgi:hypothetical protein